MRWIVLVLLLVCGIISCDPPGPSKVQLPVKVVATSYLLADVAREVGADQVQVDWLLDLGDQVEEAMLSESERHRLDGAQLVFCDGSRSEPWASERLDSPEQQARRVALETMPTGKKTAAAGLLWLDPLIMKEGAREVANRLAGLRPPQRDQFIARAEAYGAKLDSLTRLAPDLSRAMPVLILDHRWEVMLTRLKARVARIDVDPLNITPSEIARIRQRATAWRTQYVILPIDTPPARVKYIAEVTHLQVIELDPLGHQSLPGHTSYIDVIKYNYDQLRQLPPAPDFQPPEEKPE